MKSKKDEVKRRLEEVRRQSAPMQMRLDEVTNRARELEESSREMVKFFGLCFLLNTVCCFQKKNI